MSDRPPATIDEARRLLAEHRERQQKARRRKRAARRDRAGRLAADVAAQASRHQVIVPVPAVDAPGTASPDQLTELLRFLVSFEVAIRLRGHRLVIERRGRPVDAIASGTVAANAGEIAGLLQRTPCSACHRPSGRVEAKPNPRLGARPWRIVCARCRRMLRLR